MTLVTTEQADPAADVLVITSGWPGEHNPSHCVFVKRQMEALAARGVTYEVLFIHGYSSILAYPFAAIRLFVMNFRRRRYKLVHVHGGEAALAALAYRRSPLLISYLGGDLLGNSKTDGRLTRRARIRRWMITQTARAATATITKSKEMEAALPQSVRRANQVVPNGVDTRHFAPEDRGAARDRLGWSPDDPVALFVANPDEARKRYALAAAAVENIRPRLGGIRLEVVHRIPPTETPTYMNAADCLLLLSWMEGSPNVVKEALMCNLPVIATDVGDIRELLASVDPSYIVEPTIEAVGSALVACTQAPRRSNGRMQASWLSDEAISARVLAIYDELMRPDVREVRPANLRA